MKAFLALPTYSNAMRRDFVLSLLDLLWLNPIPGVEWTLGTVGGDGVARARNNLAQTFILTTECEVFVTIDVDIIFTRDQVARLLSHVSAERPIVGGLYAAKTMQHRWIKTDLPNELPNPHTGLQKVLECGTGFKAMHRSYFEGVIGAFPEIQYFCDSSPERPVKWDFFSMGVVNGRYLSEDYYADYRARKIGMDIYVDVLCQVGHEGSMRFPFKNNVEVFDNISVEKLFSMADRLGKCDAREAEAMVQLIKVACAA